MLLTQVAFGGKLTSLMTEHAVGVDHKVVRVPKVDRDYFEEA